MHYRSFVFACGAACAVLTGYTVSAASASQLQPFDATDAQSLSEQIAAVHAEMQPGGRYANLDSGHRYRIDRRVDEMAALFQRRGTVSAMTPTERVELFDAEQDTNRLLANDGATWWFCEHTPPTGSHLPRTRCWPLDQT